MLVYEYPINGDIGDLLLLSDYLFDDFISVGISN